VVQEVHTQKQDPNKDNTGKGNDDQHKLHIFINKIKYDETEGVKKTMTGRELAALVPVDPKFAEITRIHPKEEKIGIDQTITIEMADQFEIIRTNVQAG
jgi:hypothetical protein